MHKGLQLIILFVLIVFLMRVVPFGMTPTFEKGCQEATGAAKILCGEKFSFELAGRRDFLVLPGVGPKMADQLMGAKSENKSWRMLDRKVKGLGPKKMTMLKANVILP